MSVERDASRHFAGISVLFLIGTAFIQAVILIIPAPPNPGWVYWLSLGPAVVGLVSMALSIKWLILEKINNHG